MLRDKTERRIRAYMKKLDNLSEGQGRDNVAYRFAAYLKDQRLSLAEALPWLEEWDQGNSPPKGRKRLEEIFGNAEKYGRKAPDSEPSNGTGYHTPNDHHAGQKKAEAPQGLATTCLASIKPLPVRWLVPSYFPLGKLILLAGDGAHGKSALTLGLAADLTQGRPCLGLKYEAPPPAEVLMLSCEDDVADTVVPRLLSAGADLARIRKVEGVRDKEGKIQPFSLAHYEQLKTELKLRPAVRLVIIDPAGAYIGSAGVDDHKDSELRTLLGPLGELAAECRVTVLLVKHFNKGVTAKAVHKVGGSMGYVNSVRAAFVVLADPEEDVRESRVLLPIKFNLGTMPQGLKFQTTPLGDEAARNVLRDFAGHLDEDDQGRLRKQLFLIEWKGVSTADADQAIDQAGQRDRGSSKVGHAAEWLEKFLSDGACPQKDIFDAARSAGFGRDTVYKAQKESSGRIQASNRGRFGGIWYWGIGRPEDWIIRSDKNDASNNRKFRNNEENEGEFPL